MIELITKDIGVEIAENEDEDQREESDEVKKVKNKPKAGGRPLRISRDEVREL